MTDEERHRLCDALRNTHPSRIMCKEAANEIEGLVDITERYKKLSKYLCTIIREKLNELEEINND